MYQIDVPSATAVRPAATAAGTAGYFTDGNPATATPATIVPAEWLNMVQDELGAVVTAGSITKSKNTFTQVRDAIANMISAAVAGVANLLTTANVWTKQQSGVMATLTDAATIAWDVSAAQIAKVTLGGNRTLGAPTNLVACTYYSLHVIQDGTGGRSLASNAIFRGVSGVTLSTSPSARDHLVFYWDGATLELVSDRLAVGA